MMDAKPTARQIFEGLLRGVAPPRPLFLPIVFSLGAKIENVPLERFLRDPTTISNSLRKISGHLRSDGITCFYDRALEVESLGGGVDRSDAGQPAVRPQVGDEGRDEGMSVEMLSPADALNTERIVVAVEVIRRLKSLVPHDCLLTVGVTGPVTLALQLSAAGQKKTDATSEIAASMTLSLSSRFAEAGADVIFIHEDVLSTTTNQFDQAWAARLAPVVNTIRFYRRLPVLHFDSAPSFFENGEPILEELSGFVLCAPIEAFGEPNSDSRRSGEDIGVALTSDQLAETGAVDELDRVVRLARTGLHASLITTVGDVHKSTEIKRLNKVWQLINID